MGYMLLRILLEDGWKEGVKVSYWNYVAYSSSYIFVFVGNKWMRQIFVQLPYPQIGLRDNKLFVSFYLTIQIEGNFSQTSCHVFIRGDALFLYPTAVGK